MDVAVQAQASARRKKSRHSPLSSRWRFRPRWPRAFALCRTFGRPPPAEPHARPRHLSRPRLAPAYARPTKSPMRSAARTAQCGW
eukprot:2523408-Pleurochrysis_carterae.AAC.1